MTALDTALRAMRAAALRTERDSQRAILAAWSEARQLAAELVRLADAIDGRDRLRADVADLLAEFSEGKE